jgi:hypothetical protein
MPFHILQHTVPEPGMSFTHLGLFFMEVVFFIESIFFVSDYFRGVNDRWHGTTPRRMRRRIRAGAVSGGAVSTQVLAQRRERNSPQSQFNLSGGKYTSWFCKSKTNYFHKFQ